MSPKLVGEESEVRIIAALLRAGLRVLKPYGDSLRYDLVIELRDGRFLRVQCKTGRLIRGTVRFDTCSSYKHRGLGVRDYRGQAELFVVYCPGNDKTYAIPVEDVGLRQCQLRVEPSKNRQRSRVRLAIDYEVGWLRGLEPKAEKEAQSLVHPAPTQVWELSQSPEPPSHQIANQPVT